MKLYRIAAVALLGCCLLALLGGPVIGEEKAKVTGRIKEYDIKAQTVTIVTVDKKEMTFLIQNKKALAKLDDRLFVGDEVKINYVVKDGKNLIMGNIDMKGTKPGC